MTTLRPTATASRRQFLRQTLLGLAAANLASTWLPAATPFPALVVDTHTHFYDPTRAQGVPWPPKDDAVLYRTILPKNYQSLPKPQSVTGTIVVEASSWIEDNQWILDLAEKNPFIFGFVGHLPVGTQEFRPLLGARRRMELRQEDGGLLPEPAGACLLQSEHAPVYRPARDLGIPDQALIFN